MANRLLQQFTFSTEKMPVQLYMQVSFGSTGAPTLVQGSSFVSSIVRNSAGDYTITLRDAYNRLMGMDQRFLNTAAPAAPGMWIKSQAVATSKTIGIVFNAAGTPTDPASGENVYLIIFLKNSSV